MPPFLGCIVIDGARVGDAYHMRPLDGHELAVLGARFSASMSADRLDE
jgi:hypothetical protein